MDYQKVVRAEVITAMPLAPAQATRLQEQLARTTGRTIKMTTRVDPSIIGGVVARVGGTVYDGSIATQLARMRERLVEKT
jgi:F-type H+-transporting ATPase subunit delta